MTPLPLVHPDLSTFGSAVRPLRPSRIAKLLACPMQVVLTMHEDGEGGAAAQSGNLLHSGADAYHKHKGTEEERVAAGLAAIAAAREKFPDGDPEKARTWFRSYTADPKNRDADVVWCEEPVRLVLPADDTDPTGQPIVIAGTLDQVRREGGALTVWDIKTGTFNDASNTVLEYLTQQAVYTLAARATLDEKILPGGLIYTNGYSIVRGRVHLPNPLTVEQCEDLMLMIPPLVAAIRRGKPIFRPGVDACRFCHVKPWPRCHERFKAVYDS